jgi:hypothetical protein
MQALKDGGYEFCLKLFNSKDMIGIFKTNISTLQDKNRVVNAIAGHFSTTDCTLDLEDCDKVLRVICQQLEEQHVITFVRKLGYQCTVLD